MSNTEDSVSNTENEPLTESFETSRFDVLFVSVVMCATYAAPFYLLGFSLPLSAIIGIGLYLAMIALMGCTLKGFIESVKA